MPMRASNSPPNAPAERRKAKSWAALAPRPGSFSHREWLGSCSVAVLVMESAQDRDGNDSVLAVPIGAGPGRNELIEALVWGRLVEVPAVLSENREQVPLAEHENVIEALPTHASEKTFADGVRLRGSHWRLEHSRPHALGRSVELQPIFVVAIANDEAWADAERRRVAQLLRHPCRCRLAAPDSSAILMRTRQVATTRAHAPRPECGA
jgi:hypothetical protein